MSQFHYLEDEAILGSLGHSSEKIHACLPDSKARFVVLSCPIAEDGTDTERVTSAINQLHMAGLKPTVYRESGSSTIQIFLSFSALVDLDFAAAAISAIVASTDLVIHTSDKPFVLPLQKGFAWLNSDLSTKVECDQIAIEAAMEMLLHDLESNAMSPELLETKADDSSRIQEAVSLSEPSPQEQLPELAEEDEPIPLEQTDDESPQISESPVETEVSIEEDVSPVDLPETVTEVAVTGGQQLLLFPVELQLVQPELPKERPKRGRRARSSLPDDAHIGSVAPTLFSVSPFDAQGVLQFAKEVCDD